MDRAPDPLTRRFEFRFERDVARASAIFGVTARNAWVELRPGEVAARFGPWSMRTPLTNVVDAEVSGPYAWWKVAGPVRLSFTDRGATFATNKEAGVCLRFARPLAIAVPRGPLRSPGLTVTVADPDGLVEALAALGVGGQGTR